MGQPPWQGAWKQSSRGTGSSLLREGRGLMALQWWGSVRAAMARPEMAALSVPEKGRYSMPSVSSTIWRRRLYPPGFRMVVAAVMGQMPAAKSLHPLRRTAGAIHNKVRSNKPGFTNTT